MAYRIKMMISGLVKSNVLEDGNRVRKKLMAGEIVEIEDVDQKELELGYYKIVIPSIVDTSGNKIERKESEQEKQLSQLIDGMKQMIGMAENTLTAIKNSETANVPSVQVEEEKEEKRDLADFTINEDEAASESKIYTTADYKKGNEVYQNVIRNTVAASFGPSLNQTRNIDKIGNLRSKPMPTVSEERVGKIVKKKPVEILDKSGNTKRQRPINVITDKSGKIDVVKSLGINIINAKSGIE